MRHYRYPSVALFCLAAALAACSRPAPPEALPETAVADEPVTAPVITDEAGLRRAAADALSEQRIYTPAGDNAIEHYLALRRLRADDNALATALLELLPYALIASEQAVGRENFPEARRLLGLIEQADPQAPALSRLRDSIAVAEAEAARRIIAEAEAETAKRLELEVAQAAAAETERLRQAAAAPPPSAVPAPAAPTPVAAVPVPPKAQPAAPAAAPPVTLPKLLSAPSPRYPLVALRRKIEGDVTVEFTIQPDGSVRSPRIRRACSSRRPWWPPRAGSSSARPRPSPPRGWCSSGWARPGSEDGA